ncbi:MAG: ParB/RepB/Spo0J family partition protein [Solirubrobacterales bacterium]
MSAAVKKGLGRGLDALIEQQPGPIEKLPVGSLGPNPFQPRTEFDDSDLVELAASIRSQGLIQPIIVTASREPGRYWIVAGERRWRAAQRAGLTEVPVALRVVKDDQELLELALVENIQRSDLNPIEEAEAYRQLRDRFGLTQEAIAARVGKARTTVANCLRLLQLPDEVVDHLRAGRLTAGQARPLLAVEDRGRLLDLAREAVAKGLTARELERASAIASQSPRGAPKPAEPPEVHAAAAAEKLTLRYQTKVEIRRRGAGGTVLFHFHSEDELIRLYELLSQRGGAS